MKFSGEFNGYIYGQKYVNLGGDAYALIKRRADGLKRTAKNKLKEELRWSKQDKSNSFSSMTFMPKY